MISELQKHIIINTIMPFDPVKIGIFGSVARNENTQNSDIDILVDSGLKGLEFVELIENVRETIKLDVDLIDICHIEEGSLLYSEIQNTGVVIYEK
jgi:predicted nucleotidyltransferase